MKKCFSVLIFLSFVLLAFQSCSKGGSSATVEGKGAKSAEDAVSQYLDALKECDYNKILSCYAVETYVENYDIEQYVMKFYSATPVMKMIYPENDLLKQVGKYEVIDSISKMVKYQIWNLSENEFFLNGTSVMVRDSKDVKKEVLPVNADKKLAKINFSKFIPEENFLIFGYTGDYNSKLADYKEELEIGKESLDRYNNQNKKIYGCDEIKNITASFSIGGKKYLLFAETLRYGNKWYMSPNQGFIASLVGIGITNGCVVLADYLN